MFSGSLLREHAHAAGFECSEGTLAAPDASDLRHTQWYAEGQFLPRALCAPCLPGENRRGESLWRCET